MTAPHLRYRRNIVVVALVAMGLWSALFALAKGMFL